mmetsp:Transcript_16575/g.39194  ORF Transcript_16575/g.39194 Transcript_16575/m.39194 type:complete len:98 (+) Transcript_16575:1232-1525(+)
MMSAVRCLFLFDCDGPAKTLDDCDCFLSVKKVGLLPMQLAPSDSTCPRSVIGTLSRGLLSVDENSVLGLFRVSPLRLVVFVDAAISPSGIVDFWETG